MGGSLNSDSKANTAFINYTALPLNRSRAQRDTKFASDDSAAGLKSDEANTAHMNSHIDASTGLVFVKASPSRRT